VPPHRKQQAKSQRGWIAIAAPLAAVITALGVFLGPFVTGWVNLQSMHSKSAVPSVNAGQSIAIHTVGPAVPGNKPRPATPTSAPSSAALSSGISAVIA